VAALQAILGAWNQSTPNVAGNLPGWNSNNFPFPCFDIHIWKGVLCLQYVNPNSTNSNYFSTIVVVGL